MQTNVFWECSILLGWVAEHEVQERARRSAEVKHSKESARDRAAVEVENTDRPSATLRPLSFIFKATKSSIVDWLMEVINF